MFGTDLRKRLGLAKPYLIWFGLDVNCQHALNFEFQGLPPVNGPINAHRLFSGSTPP